MIIGYSLAHNQLFAPVFEETFRYVPRIKEMGFIGDESEVIIGQKCLQAEFQKHGYVEMMDALLYDHLSNQFKYYLASISVVNSNSLGFVKKRGYVKVYESDTRMYFIRELKPGLSENNKEGSARHGDKLIHFRFAVTGDIPELAKMNNDWLKDNLTDLSHGYLAAVFSEDNWAFMINRNWVVVAELI
jgi:hypothetical protein